MKKAVWFFVAIVLVAAGIWIVAEKTGAQRIESPAENSNTSDYHLVRPTENHIATDGDWIDSNEDLPGSQEPPDNAAMLGRKAFEKIKQNGYSGTIEEWLASLVGENYPGETKDAYSIAQEKGYRGSYQDWILTITGYTTKEQAATAYQVVRDHGQPYSLTAWLNTLVENPTSLGHTSGGSVSEYDRACQNGFQGTFIEWLVSLVGLK